MDHRLDVPRNACYWAGCGGKYVWVGPEGMAALSEFVLILQQIARADLGSALAPQPLTRTVETTFAIAGEKVKAKATLYLDENGWLTPGANQSAIPSKGRRTTSASAPSCGA